MEELTWWIVFAGLALAVLGVTNVVIILGGVMVLVARAGTPRASVR